MIITIKDLSFALLHSWNADTAKGDWKVQVPSLNQCAVTALIVQDYFGGDLMRCKLNDDDSHYWNRISDGNEIDLTFEQFAYTGQTDVGETVIRSRDYVLSFPDTLKRYEILKYRIEEFLFGQQNIS
jgi:hypothetical protein